MVLSVAGIIFVLRDEYRADNLWYNTKQTVFYALVVMLNGYMAFTNFVRDIDDHYSKFYVFLGTQAQHLLLSTIDLNSRLLAAEIVNNQITD